jgi:hypothetical protein
MLNSETFHLAPAMIFVSFAGIQSSWQQMTDLYWLCAAFFNFNVFASASLSVKAIKRQKDVQAILNVRHTSILIRACSSYLIQKVIRSSSYLVIYASAEKCWGSPGKSPLSKGWTKPSPITCKIAYYDDEEITEKEWHWLSNTITNADYYYEGIYE